MRWLELNQLHLPVFYLPTLMLLLVSHTTYKQINIIFQVRLPSIESGLILVLCPEPSLVGWVCGEIILFMADSPSLTAVQQGDLGPVT